MNECTTAHPRPHTTVGTAKWNSSSIGTAVQLRQRADGSVQRTTALSTLRYSMCVSSLVCASASVRVYVCSGVCVCAACSVCVSGVWLSRQCGLWPCDLCVCSSVCSLCMFVSVRKRETRG